MGVLALERGGKAPNGPLAPRGAYSATRDPKRIGILFSVIAPHANIGVALAGHVVLDIDPRHNGDISQMEACGELPRSWRTLTGGGGMHLWFRLPPETALRIKNPWTGIDIKTGPGMYVAAVPSVTTSPPCKGRTGPYTWHPDFHPRNTPMAEAPAWLINLPSDNPPSRPGRTFLSRTTDDERVKQALFSIPAVDREVWIACGQALQAHFGEAGRDLFHEWSATCPEKYDQRSCDRVWASFRGTGRGIGTIFFYASQRAA
jgi:hypothetical protein